MSGGRPSVYTEELAAQICALLASGRTLREICRADDMPARSTVQAWVLEDKAGFSARYARARELQLEEWADETIEIADDGTNDWAERQVPDGSTQKMADHEHITRSRLRVDTRKWLLSQLASHTYGSKTQHTGLNDGPITTDVTYRWADPPKPPEGE